MDNKREVLAVATQAAIKDAASFFHVEGKVDGEASATDTMAARERSFALTPGAAKMLQNVLGRFTESLYFSLFRDGTFCEGMPSDLGPKDEWPKVVKWEDVARVARQVDAAAHAFS